jgi:hypothetical protein
MLMTGRITRKKLARKRKALRDPRYHRCLPCPSKHLLVQQRQAAGTARAVVYFRARKSGEPEFSRLATKSRGATSARNCSHERQFPMVFEPHDRFIVIGSETNLLLSRKRFVKAGSRCEAGFVHVLD